MAAMVSLGPADYPEPTADPSDASSVASSDLCDVLIKMEDEDEDEEYSGPWTLPVDSVDFDDKTGLLVTTEPKVGHFELPLEVLNELQDELEEVMRVDLHQYDSLFDDPMSRNLIGLCGECCFLTYERSLLALHRFGHGPRIICTTTSSGKVYKCGRCGFVGEHPMDTKIHFDQDHSCVQHADAGRVSEEHNYAQPPPKPLPPPRRKPDVDFSKPERTGFTCALCSSYAYHDMTQLTFHYMFSHRAYQCKCGAVKKTYKEFVTHFDDAHQNLVCPVCHLLFSSTEAALRHFFNYHRPFKCDCDNVLYTMWSTYYHLSECPSVPQVFKCSFCSELFSHNHDLVEHIQGNHEYNYSSLSCEPDLAKGPLVCSVCAESCESCTELKDHYEAVHELRCPECPRRLPTKDLFTQHMAEEHGAQTCYLCGFASDDVETLRRHVKDTHMLTVISDQDSQDSS